MKLQDFLRKNNDGTTSRGTIIFDDFLGERKDLLAHLQKIYKTYFKGSLPVPKEKKLLSDILGLCHDFFIRHQQDFQARKNDHALGATFYEELANLAGNAGLETNTKFQMDVFERFLMDNRPEKLAYLTQALVNDQIRVVGRGKDGFSNVRSLICDKETPWSEQNGIAPSLWLMDIQILGSEAFFDGLPVDEPIRNGIDLARFIRKFPMECTRDGINWHPVPIFFLTGFSPTRSPEGIGPIREYILDVKKGVPTPFKYFQHMANLDTPFVEHDLFTGTATELTLQQFVTIIRREING